ncbi:DUF2950 domain-containing protein [Caldimonas brevitalea]|uniref:DUF2950 domain-containing protein n=1 Tax=Caldimonas brevitalea TaxID=413882 RepID=A0A0G3BIS1_9BURK|nr:DUF2950 domain-containing protein [Caldimonas brevitalea]AKJ29329.1 hypothetical protein AAW51_2638 [Caldimonas brevitalea]
MTFAFVTASLLASANCVAQQTYRSAEDAAQAFVDALRRSDRGALEAVLGPNGKGLIPAGGIGQDDIDAFLAAWQTQHKIETQTDGTALISVGQAGWTLPIPLIASSGGWRFDPQRGAEQLRTRRIGRNELGAIQASLAYFDAQREYALKDRDGNGVLEYAQKLVSAPGRHDGLYWPDAQDQEASPLGPLFASRKPRGGAGYQGYFYKVLKAQGEHAPGGAYHYIVGGRMRSGFALIAWPSRYGHTGVMSFMVNHDGRVYEKDLGPRTDEAVQAITRFDPDASWKKVAVPEH